MKVNLSLVYVIKSEFDEAVGDRIRNITRMNYSSKLNIDCHFYMLEKSDEALEFLNQIVAELEELALQSETKLKRAVYIHEGTWNSVEECYNDALDKVKGEYVHFMHSEVIGSITKKLPELYGAFDKYGVGLVAMLPVQYVGGNENAQLYFTRRNYVVNLEKTPYNLNLDLPSFFIERRVIGDLRFDTDSVNAEEMFLISLFVKEKRYFQSSVKLRIGEYLSNDFYNYDKMFYKEWYTRELRNIYIPFLKANRDSVIAQASIMQMIQLKLAANLNDRSKSVLSEAESTEFLDTFKEILQDIPDNVILQTEWNHKRTLQRFMGMNYLRLKYGQTDFPLTVEQDENDKDVVKFNDVCVEYISNAVFNVYSLNYENKKLTFEGELANIYYFGEENPVGIKLVCEDIDSGEETVYEVVRNEIYSLVKYFAKSVKKGFRFDVDLPYEAFAGRNVKFWFVMDYQGQEAVVKCEFVKFQTHLNLTYHKCYWNFKDGILSYDAKEKTFIIEPSTAKNCRRHEKAFEKNVTEKNAKRGFKSKMKFLIFRKMCLIFRRFKKKQIWITFDQLFKGGDNGEYFFRYVNDNHKKSANMYYIVNRNAVEYPALKKKYGNRVLVFKSFRARFMSINADVVFATRVDVKLYFGFNPGIEKMYRDLFDAKVLCLQHGLTMQNIAQYQNRSIDNLRHYFCVSPYEVANIMKPIYGYDDKMISLTGAPRYDGLVGEPKKQIIITPTWRRNVTAGTNEKGKNHEYSVNFKNTTYFKIYNTLINDERLIECAKKTGYKLIYLIHPILSPQIDDYDRNEFVEIIPGSLVNYETILKESSLMVTDYSGIQFDFAYQRKPLIYYHPDELPPQYDESTLDDVWFGPICRNNDEVVNALCRAMENECQLEAEYKENIEKFFPYADQNNCQRVYEATMAYLSGDSSKTVGSDSKMMNYINELRRAKNGN